MNPRVYDKTWLRPSIAEDLRRVARRGFYDGTERTYHVVQRCAGLHLESGTKLIFTRDIGHHSSGWWKNPDYERCWHLSLSFLDPLTGETRPRDRRQTKEWVDLFFGRDKSKLWCEPPYYPDGRRCDTWHYRLLATIEQGIRKGLAPTVREIGEAHGIRSPNGVMAHLDALQAKGYITRSKLLSRAIQLNY